MSTIRYIELFARLGESLAHFGEDASSQKVIDAACGENSWFSSSDIINAMRSLATNMLGREILSEWLDRYDIADVTEGKNIAVVMAGNIPAVGFFDLMCVVISGHRCYVKKSSKDSVLIDYLIRLLKDICPDVRICDFNDGLRYDAVIATGSDNANRYFRSRFNGIPSLLRGNRSSLAVLNGRESDSEICALADDMFSYNGLGCRNVSLLFIPKGYDIVRLGEKIAMQAKDINPKYMNNYRQTKAMLSLREDDFLDFGFFVMREEEGFSNIISQVNYVVYDNTDKLSSWLSVNDSNIQCIISNAVDHSRCVVFGASQSPRPWDYPDGVDVIEFLGRLY